MENMNEVFQAVHAWNQSRGDNDLMHTLLNQGDCFFLNTLLPGGPDLEGAPIHAYPSVWNGNLHFVCINSDNDTVDVYNSGEMFEHIEICPVERYSSLPTEEIESFAISSKEAKNRIDLWNVGHDSWITNQIQTPMGIYRAFQIPFVDSIAGNQHLARFALNDETRYHGLPTADLIVEDHIGSLDEAPMRNQYFDLVTPVPPFAELDLRQNLNTLGTPPSVTDFFILLKSELG